MFLAMGSHLEPQWFHMAQNIGLEAKIKSLEDSDQNLQFHSLK